jgi:DNA-binding CsgD family transcriptional regulator
LGLSDKVVIPDIVEALSRLVYADSCCFFWAGDDYQESAVYSQNDGVYKTFDAYQALRASGQLKQIGFDFSEWMRQPTALNTITHERIYLNSAFFSEVTFPCRCRHIIMSVVADRQRGWGAIVLSREPRRKPFTNSEHRVLESFKQHVMHALQPPTQPESAQLHDYHEDDSAVLLVDWKGCLLHCSTNAKKLLRFANNEMMGKQQHASQLGDLLRPLLTRLQRLHCGQPTAQARIETTNRWGRFVWRGYPLESNPGSTTSVGFIVYLQHLKPLQLTTAHGAHALGLSAQQQLIAVRWAAGQSQRQIAQALRIKDSTVVDHIRGIYDRLNVHDSTLLSTRLVEAGKVHAS